MQRFRDKFIDIYNSILNKINKAKSKASQKQLVFCFIIFLLVFISIKICITFQREFFWIKWNKEHLEKQIKTCYMAISMLYFIFTAFWSSIVIGIYKLKKGNKKVISFLKYFIPYFSIMLLILILVYPGIYKGDEFYVLQAAYVLKIEYMQHYLIDLLYIVCWMIYPEMITVTVMFVLIISTIIAKTMQEAEELFDNKKIVWLLYIPLFFLPVIDNNLFPLRNSIIVYLFVRLCFSIYLYSKNKEKVLIIRIIILSAIIAALKTEFLYLMIAIPIAIKLIANIKIKEALIMCLAIAIIIKTINIEQGKNEKNTYILTAIWNPLSNILADSKHKPVSEEDINNISKITDYDNLINEACYENIPSFFSDEYTKNKVSNKEKKDFIISSIKIIINNMDLFFMSRTVTFLLTSGMVKNYINHTGHENPNWTLKLDYNKGIITKQTMKKSDPPLGYELRKNVISFINCRDFDNYKNTNILYPFVYNVIPQICALIVLFFVGIIKKKRNLSTIVGIILLQFPIIFLTAPAAFWMYYMPLYMSGNVVLTFVIAKYFDEKGEKNEYSNNNGWRRKKV